MYFRIYGKLDAPVVLMAPDQGMEDRALLDPLSELALQYCLLFPAYTPGMTEAEAARECADYIRKTHAGRIWGAYGLRFGGRLLLELAALREVRIHTVIVEGVDALPAASLSGVGGRIFFWMGARDRKAKKVCKALREQLPRLHTLTMKKLKSGADYISVRPDLMQKRLLRTFGKAKLVSVSSMMEKSADRLWRELAETPHGTAERLLSETEPVSREDETYTQIVEGKGKALSFWSHMTHLESKAAAETLFTDQVELNAGLLSAPVRSFAKLALRRDQRRRAK